MTFDTCPYCEGSGIRDWMSGAPCYFCNGTGGIEDEPDDDDFEEYDNSNHDTAGGDTAPEE